MKVSITLVPMRDCIGNERKSRPTPATNDFFPVMIVSLVVGIAPGLSCLIGLTRVPEFIGGFACEAIDSTIQAAATPY